MTVYFKHLKGMVFGDPVISSTPPLEVKEYPKEIAFRFESLADYLENLAPDTRNDLIREIRLHSDQLKSLQTSQKELSDNKSLEKLLEIIARGQLPSGEELNQLMLELNIQNADELELKLYNLVMSDNGTTYTPESAEETSSGI